MSKHAGAGVAKPTEMTKRGKKKDEKKSDDAEAKRVKSGELMRAADYPAAFTAVLVEIGMSAVNNWLHAYESYS